MTSIFPSRRRPSRAYTLGLENRHPSFRIESRLMPGAVAFYHNPSFAYGVLESDVGVQVQPVDPNEDGTAQDYEQGAAGAGAEAHLSNTIIGTLGQWGSDGEFHEGDDNVSVQETGLANVNFAGPADDPASNTQAIEFVGSLQTTDQVTADANGPYALDGAAGIYNAAAHSSTAVPYNFVIQDASGNPPGPGDTVTINFSVTLTPTQDRFWRGATLVIRSSHLNVDLHIGDGEGTTGLNVTDPSTSTVLEDDSTFGGIGGVAHYETQFTVPAVAVETVTLNAGLYSYPLGNFNNEIVAQDSELDYTFSETLN